MNFFEEDIVIRYIEFHAVDFALVIKGKLHRAKAKPGLRLMPGDLVGIVMPVCQGCIQMWCLTKMQFHLLSIPRYLQAAIQFILIFASSVFRIIFRCIGARFQASPPLTTTSSISGREAM